MGVPEVREAIQSGLLWNCLLLRLGFWDYPEIYCVAE